MECYGESTTNGDKYMKYFVKYKEEYVSMIGSNHGCSYVRKTTPKTRFFDTDDIEQEWIRFESLCENKVKLIGIQVL